MTNILNAINNIVNQTSRITSPAGGEVRNRMNNMGSALENYIKNAFAGTFDIDDAQKRNRIYNQTFSWLGNQNNPPDFMIRGGDAIEVKKIENINSDLALNSSYPKSRLLANNPMITTGCRNCEAWDIKDIIYSVGSVREHNLSSLWMVYGSIYAAEPAVYERIKLTMSKGIKEIPDMEFAETKELGRVNRVDPLGITNLRIRGMWSIQNPRRVFEYIPRVNRAMFEFISIIPDDKYASFNEESRSLVESIDIETFSITDVEVRNPNNPANLIKSKLIRYHIKS